MRSPDNVLLGTAILLLAGVILYNVFFTEPQVAEPAVAPSETVSAAETTTVSTTETTAPAYTKVNINTATAEELETLSGIGPAKAQAIVAYRETNGPFSSVNELVNVSGIGEKTLAKIIDDITV
ncbi:MAG: helix-hairpin-helix domain-containing protein [Clostridia bacterium]|nr:helix-hairpin-helix domain-containing protein [Clostridia bacterium]MBR5015407.1 helix-hairpin-helix domain-containing protein [Clostridia bacterium]MBR5977358.1 helix-hairpin-helix domain-containing protein [Clostridia bacterium]MBR5991257.1 helix-hairpin-helix domain-containing protein [Clostridia bacterium]MBR6479007.1 helix-hairpin-helix domain-containing protein [Clostridia bacterium]